MNSKWGNKVLWIFYLAIIGLFGYLNIYHQDMKSILTVNTYVSIAMLAIAGGIIFHAWRKYLRNADKIINDVNKVTQKINEDATDRSDFLWNEYKKNELLFSVDYIQHSYDSYRQEMLRLEKNVAEGYKCDIEEFINYDLIDSVINKGFLSLIPGVMTGLGILGTFVGLSFGLQEFNTGTAEEISDSIAPLMEGIKVAFHTSIYGMVMSLVFNFVYKKKIESAYRSIDELVNEWTRHVVPNAGNEGMNRILEYQDKLTGDMSDMSEHAIDRMAEKLASILLPEYEKIHIVTGQILETTTTFGQEVAKTLNEALAPEFSKLNETISSFAEVTAKTQIDGVNQMVDTFMERLNENLADRFTKLAQVIDDTCDLQKKNSDLLKETIDWISNTVKEIGTVNMESQKTVSCLQEYLEKLNILQKKINEDVALVEVQTEKNGEVLSKTEQHNQVLQEYIKQIVDVTTSFGQEMQAQAVALQDISKSAVEGVQQNLDIIRQKSAEHIEITAKAAEGYAKEVTEQMQKEVVAISESAKQQVDTIIGITRESENQIKAQTEAIQDMGSKTVEEMEKSLYAVSQNAKDQIEIMQKTAEGAVESVERQAVAVTLAIEDEAEKSVKSIRQAQKEAADNSKEVMGSLISQVNSYTGDMQSYLKDFAMQLSKQLEAYAVSLSKEMQTSTEKMRADIVASVGVVNQEIKDSLVAIREMEKVIQNSNVENIENLNKRIEEFVITMTTTVKDQLSKIVEYKNQTNIDLNKATKQLYDAATKLDMDIQDNLEKTFDSFDKNLAAITMHLSGTIAEVDNTTKRVPAVVNASYEGMEKSLKQMEENLQTLVKELNNLVRQVEKKY